MLRSVFGADEDAPLRRLEADARSDQEGAGNVSQSQIDDRQHHAVQVGLWLCFLLIGCFSEFERRAETGSRPALSEAETNSSL